MKNQTAPWLLLFGRTALFVIIQSLFALGFFLAGSSSAWVESETWWMMGVVVTNFICLAAMMRLFHAEGKNYWDIFRIDRKNVKSDLLALFGIMLLLGPVSMLPNIILANWLFGSPEIAVQFLIRPLPFWATYSGMILFSVTQGMVELALYFAYIMPRLFTTNEGARPSWLALSFSALMLGLQHFAIPVSSNINGILWHGLMFIPFAFLAGIVLRWRPRLLPYMAIIHALMDLSFAMMLLPVAY